MNLPILKRDHRRRIGFAGKHGPRENYKGFPEREQRIIAGQGGPCRRERLWRAGRHQIGRYSPS